MLGILKTVETTGAIRPALTEISIASENLATGCTSLRSYPFLDAESCPPAGFLQPQTTPPLYRVADLSVTLRWFARKVFTSLGWPDSVRWTVTSFSWCREDNPCGSGRARSTLVHRIQEPDFFNTSDTVLISYARRLHSPVAARVFILLLLLLASLISSSLRLNIIGGKRKDEKRKEKRKDALEEFLFASAPNLQRSDRNRSGSICALANLRAGGIREFRKASLANRSFETRCTPTCKYVGSPRRIKPGSLACK